MEIPLVSIRIPCYNHPYLLINCLKSIDNQSFKDYEIVIVDDCSLKDYKETISKFSHLNIKYFKNEINLGAINNMVHALRLPTKSEFIVVFHEDDLMHSGYLESVVEVMNLHKVIPICLTTMGFFKDYNYQLKNLYFNEEKKIRVFNTQELIKLILIRGKALSFSSAIYRNSSLNKEITFDLSAFGELGDRPFFIEQTKNSGIGIIFNNLVFAYDHTGEDKRWNYLRENHIFNLYNYYWSYISKEIKKEEKRNFIIGTTHGMIEEGYNLLFEKHQPLFFFFIIKALLKTKFSLKYYLLMQKRIRTFIEKINRLFLWNI